MPSTCYALGATSSPCAQDIKKIPDSVGTDQLHKAISELKERNITEVVAQDVGSSPVRLLVGPDCPAAAGSAALDVGPALAASRGEERQREESEEADEDVAFGCF